MRYLLIWYQLTILYLLKDKLSHGYCNECSGDCSSLAPMEELPFAYRIKIACSFRQMFDLLKLVVSLQFIERRNFTGISRTSYQFTVGGQ